MGERPAGSLQVHDDEEQHGEVGEPLEQRREQRRRERGDLEEREVEHRLRLAQLDEDEGTDEHDAADQVAGDRSVEGGRGELGDGPEHAEQTEAEGDHTGQVEVAAGAFAPVVQHPGCQQQRRRADRHVDPEDPPPRDVGDDEPPDDDAEHGPEAPADGVVAVGAAPPLSRVEVGDHRPAVGGDEGARRCPGGSGSR